MYTVGDKVTHPMHGAGVIEQIVTRQENAGARQYYLLRLCVDSMTVLMPCDCCEAVGLRPTITSEQARQLLEQLDQVPLQKEGNWNQRYRENMERLKSGDLYEVARVIKGLMRRERLRGLSTGERKMLHSARQILISELVLVQCASYQDVEARIDDAMLHSPAG